MQPEPQALKAACEQAWAELDAAHRDMPACEHVTAWKARIDAAAKRHRAALRAYERAAEAPGGRSAASPVPPSLPLVPEPARDAQGALFELGADAA